jgi:transposase
VGSLTALAFVLIIGRADRFQCGKQIASYLGLVPLEKSSGNQRRLGHITKQGNTLLRFLLVEAAQVTVRSIRNGVVSISTWQCGEGREDRQSRHGPQVSRSNVLDCAKNGITSS